MKEGFVNSEELGGRLRMVREKLNMTLDEFYGACGIDKTLGSKYEKGEVLPKVDTLVCLWQKHGINPGWILTGHGNAWIWKPGEEGYSRDLIEKALFILGRDRPVAFLTEDPHVVLAVHYAFAYLGCMAFFEKNSAPLEELFSELTLNETFLKHYSFYSYYHPVEAAVRATFESGMESVVLGKFEALTKDKPAFPTVFVESSLALCVEIGVYEKSEKEKIYVGLGYCRNADHSFTFELHNLSREEALDALRKDKWSDGYTEIRNIVTHVKKMYLDPVFPRMDFLKEKALYMYKSSQLLGTTERLLSFREFYTPPKAWRSEG